ncbi:MAG: GNAT family N-acetyltransferase [Deltaproteobacteria bacterium]|nr:GNAT family N-acetyltransferase [Deltaproteobacteria bacterium]
MQSTKVGKPDMNIESLSAAMDPSRFRFAFTSIRDQSSCDLYLKDHAAYLELAMDPCWHPMEYWLACDGEQPIGRVGARISSVDPTRGYIGLLACDVEAPRSERLAKYVALLETALRWLGAQGVTAVFAPVDCNTWLRYRVISGVAPQDGADGIEAPFGWEPPFDPDLEAALKATGFGAPETIFGDKSMQGRYHTRVFRSVFRQAMRVLEPHHKRALRDGYTFRSFGADGRSFDDELALLHGIAIPSFSRQFLFEPIDLGLFKRIYRSGAGQLDLSPSAFILPPEDGSGAVIPVGFLFGFVDRGYVVVKTVAVQPDLVSRTKGRKWSAASALLYHALQYGDEQNLRGGIAALVHDDGSANTIEKWLAWASDWTRHYELFARAI